LGRLNLPLFGEPVDCQVCAAQHTIVAPAAGGGATVSTLSVNPLADVCAHTRSQGFDETTNVDVVMPLKGDGTYTRSANIAWGWPSACYDGSESRNT
jgi:hypothetical protein